MRYAEQRESQWIDFAHLDRKPSVLRRSNRRMSCNLSHFFGESPHDNREYSLKTEELCDLCEHGINGPLVDEAYIVYLLYVYIYIYNIYIYIYAHMYVSSSIYLSMTTGDFPPRTVQQPEGMG